MRLRLALIAVALSACTELNEPLEPAEAGVDQVQTPAGATCVTVQRGLAGSTVADSFVNAASTLKNYGTNNNLLAGMLSGAERRALVRFSLPTLPPSATLASATLAFTVQAPGGTGTLSLHRATSSWSESLVTWSTQPTFTASAAATASSGSPSFNVTSLVASWYAGTANNGVVVRQSPAYTNLNASESLTASSRPKLVVCYTTPSASCTDGLKNGAETDVDCGGGACPDCADGDTCAVADDCVSGACIGGTCQPAGGESVAIVNACTLPTDPGPTGVKETLDVTFTSTGMKLDVARPISGGPYPAVVVVHSGGWTAGDKQARREDVRALATRGYVVVNANYRLAPATHSPGQQSDVRCAVRWARSNASTYGIDATRVYAIGLSSGGQLAESLGADAELDLDDGTCLVGGDHHVQKVAAWYGIPDLRTNAVVGSGALASVQQYLGCQPDACPAPAALASPIAHLDAGDAPLLLSHGTSDTTVPYAQSTAYRDAVRAAGVNATLVTYSGGTHGYSLFEANAHVPSSCTLLAFLAQ